MNHYHLILLAVLLPVVVSGCGFFPEYSASQVRAEYADVSDPLTRSLANNQTNTPGKTSSAVPSSAESQIESNDPLSLSRVMDIAIANNPNLQQAAHRVARARAMKALSDSAFWPAVGFYTEYTQGDAPSAYLFMTFDQRQLPKNI
jgi:outer membrane protein